MSKNKHMDINTRIQIFTCLNLGMSFKAIALEISKDCTTVSKEIRKRSIQRNESSFGRVFNNCLNRYDCQLYNVCSKCNSKRSRRCRFCRSCRNECDFFIEEICPKLSKPPYVCNGCDDKSKCSLTKTLYSPLEANKSYKST